MEANKNEVLELDSIFTLAHSKCHQRHRRQGHRFGVPADDNSSIHEVVNIGGQHRRSSQK